jgi:arsenate reductase (thioredoxin)
MTDSPTTPARSQRDLSIDQGLALQAAAERLESEFGDTFDAETIDRFLDAAHAHFAHHASVPNFLPLLSERFAQQQLRALARVDGKHHDGKPTVLFLCTHNAGRSQMAAAFFTELAGEDAVAWSGGSDPGDEVNPAVVQAMSERGIDISHEYPKPFTDEIVQAADVVITMGCGDACPVIPGRRYEEWTFDDPSGADVEAVRPIRDAIEQRVRRLLTELNVPVRA